MSDGLFSRRGMLAGAGLTGATLAAAGGMVPAASKAAQPDPGEARRTLSAARFGAVGDGQRDDSAALQQALDATFADAGGSYLTIPPGTYKVSRPLRVTIGPHSPVGAPNGILARGATLHSAIDAAAPVLSIDVRSSLEYTLIEGLSISGNGREGHGLDITCGGNQAWMYNACLRDVVVRGVGGDGCSVIGDIFESQFFNCHFRDNKGNGLTLGHGPGGGTLSAMHLFGCVLGHNGRYGAQLTNGAYDVGFHGCYILLNGQHGLVAPQGVTLLENCGFENNHTEPGSPGGPAIRLGGFATMIASGAYSQMRQLSLVEAGLDGELVMIGCRGFGDGPAKAAGLCVLSGTPRSTAMLIGCHGTVQSYPGFEPIQMGGTAGGLVMPTDWRSPGLLRLGEHRLWVDGQGHLRMKKGAPGSDQDGQALGV